MILETSALFVSTISALSSVVQAVKAVRDLSDDEIAKSEAIEAPDTANESTQALAATGIDEEYIEIAQANIKKALDRFKQVWRDPSLPQAVKDQELDAADFAVCSELKRIMRLNGGPLPGDDRFHHLWGVHNCQSV